MIDCLLLVGRELFEKGHFCRASVCDCYNLQGSANEGDELFSYTIITVDAAPSLKWLHNRMPVSPTIICLWVFQFIVLTCIVTSSFLQASGKSIHVTLKCTIKIKNIPITNFIFILIFTFYKNKFLNHFNLKAILHGEEEVCQWLDCGAVPWKEVGNPFW